MFMKNLVLAALLVLTASAWAQDRPAVSQTGTTESPSAILAKMKQVADWQLTNASPSAAHNRKDNENAWTYGAFYAGVMALDSIAGTPKYHDAMVAEGKKLDWQPGRRPYHADDYCVGQMSLELYLKDQDPAMLAPIMTKLDNILAHPSTNSLEYNKNEKADRFWWCDSLFMGPPTWARMYRVTGERK